MSFAISEDYEYFEMEFDSLDAINAANTNVATTDWPIFSLRRPLTNIAAVKIIEVQIPFTFYVFNSNNNTFTMSVAGICADAFVTIPIGNYTATTLATALKTALDTALLSQGSPTSLRWTVTYSGASASPSTGKFTFTLPSIISTATSFTFGNTGDTGNYNPRIMLGFNGGVNSATYVISTGMVMEAPNVNLVTGPNYMYLNSRRLGALCNLYLPADASNIGGGTNGPQMAKIPINVQPQGVIYWSDPNTQHFFDLENLVNFSDVDFYFTLGNSSNQVPLQFNGQSFSLKLAVLVNKTVSSVAMNGLQGERVYRRMVPR